MMKKHSTLLVFLSIMLAACTATTYNGTPSDENSQAETTTQEKSNQQNQKDLALPDGFPTDFPIPYDFKITKVRDQSDNE